MKTLGQVLYEKLYPKMIQVVRVEDSFKTNPFWVPNPVHHADWNLLTERCRQSYEQQAIGHHLVTSSEKG